MDERRGVAYAQVKVASPLSGEQEQLLRTMLSDSIHKTVFLRFRLTHPFWRHGCYYRVTHD